MFCPVCKAEYRQGFFRCSDCDVPLVVALRGGSAEEKGSEPEDYGEPPVALWHGRDPVTFTALVSALDAAGIPHNDFHGRDHAAYLSRPLHVDFYGVPDFTIRVFPRDLERAKDVLEAALRPALGIVDGGREENANRETEMDEDLAGELAELPESENGLCVIWTGQDAAAAQFLRDIFRENGLTAELREHSPGLQLLLVRPENEARARYILREALEGRPPA